MLGLKDQPRAVVFHVKEGREHCHVVWSRIDAEHRRAVHLAFDHDKLMRVTRAFARDHGIPLPKGYEKSRQVGQVSLYEQVQKQETGLSKADHMREVTDAWQQSDDARAFVGREGLHPGDGEAPLPAGRSLRQRQCPSKADRRQVGAHGGYPRLPRRRVSG
jgi:hypothetical protein